jgi:2-aminoethylphosphonate-pyruvate transaminase
MNNYKLLTPGPLTTTSTVKEEMLFDRCTWDDDYKKITQKIRTELLQLAGALPELYTAVLMQGSGSFGVESVITTAIGKKDKCLIITNGAYGERIVTMAKYIGINYDTYSVEYNSLPEVKEIRNILERDKDITHIAMVHCETTTGILNPIEEVSKVAKEYGKTLIIDAMSSFGGIPINVEDLEIDYLISSANKCIQGVPGFSFVIANIEKLSKCKGNSRSLCLDLYDQWKGMDKEGKWRYTSPTHVVAAFSKAIDELLEEGGVEARHIRYKENNSLLRKSLKEVGINSYIEEKIQSPIITTFLFPNSKFNFDNFYRYIKERGFVIYPGKLTDVDTFRVGNIGEIYKEDIKKLYIIIKEYMEGDKNE